MQYCEVGSRARLVDVGLVATGTVVVVAKAFSCNLKLEKISNELVRLELIGGGCSIEKHSIGQQYTALTYSSRWSPNRALNIHR